MLAFYFCFATFLFSRYGTKPLSSIRASQCPSYFASIPSLDFSINACELLRPPQNKNCHSSKRSGTWDCDEIYLNASLIKQSERKGNRKKRKNSTECEQAESRIALPICSFALISIATTAHRQKKGSFLCQNVKIARRLSQRET